MMVPLNSPYILSYMCLTYGPAWLLYHVDGTSLQNDFEFDLLTCLRPKSNLYNWTPLYMIYRY